MKQTRREFIQTAGTLIAVSGMEGDTPNSQEKGAQAPTQSETDYRPLDLSSFYNADTGFTPDETDLPLDSQVMRGLPFRIGSSPDKPCFMGFGPDGYLETVEIPVQQTVRWVIFAHRLLESHIHDGEPVGRIIAEYHFQFKDGEAVRVPIRERLEIATVPANWGLWPLLAVPDAYDSMAPRYEGSWGELGTRQTEALMANPSRFWLWAWPNPHPERELARIRIEPKDRPFLIAGLTLSPLEEDPFGREPRQPVVIRIKDEQLAKQRFNLSVEVDRGEATYPYPLPSSTAASFVQDMSFKGWGEAYNYQCHPAYVEISALPSATVRVKQGEEEIAVVRWQEMLSQKAVDTPRSRLELVHEEKNWVHVTVLDDQTGKPTPCRVHFRSPEGIPYQPHGHHDHLLSDMNTWHIDNGGDVRLGHVTYAYIDGTCQGWLPRGEVIVDVAKGFEYEPLRTAVKLEPGQRELVLRLKRFRDMNAERWFSGDTHVHFLSTLGAQLEARGEDVNVVNLLQSQWGHLFTNTEEFIGRPLASPDGRTVVYTSQENRQHILGHLSLLGLKRPVMPWCTDGPSEAELGGPLETTLSHWADACHEQGGTVITPHMPAPNCELAALIATGRVDGLEFTAHGMYPHHEYYRYLNGGYRIPVVGGTDKMAADVPVGIYRTYVYIPPDEEFTYDNWCKHLKAGRTFMSGGPLLEFTVNGSRVGDTLRLSGNGGTVEAAAEASSLFPIHTLEIVQEGRVVATAEEAKGSQRLQLKTSLPVERHTWLAARVSGPGYTQSIQHYDGWRRGVMGHTSPIYISVGGEWWMHSEDTAQYMLTLLNGGLEYIQTRSRQHRHGSVTHHHGEEDHLAYLQRPFREAIEKVQSGRGK